MFMEIAFTTCLLYGLTSWLLFRYPQLIHGKPKSRKALHRLIAHRGGAGEKIENTMSAFQHAYDLGADMFELDVLLTKDNRVVVVHDNDLKRLCGVEAKICDFEYGHLPPLLCTQCLDFDKKFQVTYDTDDRRIILLEELFQEFPKMPMNIDIKVDSGRLISEVKSLVFKHNRAHITVLGNGDTKLNERIKSAGTETMTLYSLKDLLRVVALYQTGLLPFVSLPDGYFEIPMCSVFLDNAESFPQRTNTWNIRLLFRFLNMSLTNRKLIEHLYQRGIPTYYFVLNKENEWRTAAETGAAGIMTDFPTNLKDWISKNRHLFVVDSFQA